MARKSLIQRQHNRYRLWIKFRNKRKYLKFKIQKSVSLKDKIGWHFQLQNLPRNSSQVRLKRRCLISGRPKGVFRFFGLSRHFIREYAHIGFLPGVTKASW